MIADTHVDSELGKFRRSGRYSKIVVQKWPMKVKVADYMPKEDLSFLNIGITKK